MLNKRFKTEKRGYCISEVDLFILEQSRVIAQLKEHNAALSKELEQKQSEIDSLNQKQDLIAKSILSAMQKAEQIEHLIKQKYLSELGYLKAFQQQWTMYYEGLIKKYPLSDELNALAKFNRQMDQILSGEMSPEDTILSAKEQFENENKRLKKKYIGYIPVSQDYDGRLDDELENFNPEENIRQLLRRQVAEEEKSKKGKNEQAATNSIAATKEAEEQTGSGFSFEEALNPKQKLSEILKEIGITQEDGIETG